MTERKWTQGPWVADCDRHNPIIASNYGRIATVGISTEAGTDRTDANAHLIAAAPELYEALEDCLVALSQAGAHGELKLARAALEKARGES